MRLRAARAKLPARASLVALDKKIPSRILIDLSDERVLPEQPDDRDFEYSRSPPAPSSPEY